MEKVWKKWMNLQLFAEGADAPEGDGGEPEPTGAEKPKDTDAPKERTYTQSEMIQMVNSEADKRVSQAVAKQKREYEKKLSLSGLSEQERTMAEKDQQIAEMQEQLKELSQYKTRQAVMTELSTRGIAPELADLIALTDDEAEMKTRLDTLEAAYRKAVEAGVKERLTGGAPGKGSGSAPTMTREAFRKLPLMDQQKLYETDPETYRKMTEG